MFIGFTGGLGSGKTKGMVYFGRYFNYLCKLPVYTNFYTSFGIQVQTWKELTEQNSAIVLLDELYILMDSRFSGAVKFSKNSSVFRTHFMLQTRKKNMIVMYTSQSMSQIDKRVKLITDYIFLCEKLKGIHRYTQLDMSTNMIGKTYRIKNINEANNWYNTNEIINYLK